MRRVAASLAVTTGLGLMFLSPSVARASEEVDVTVAEVGWWSTNPAALPQADGGFQVGATPTGETQDVAALRLVIAGSSISSLQVQFDEASSIGTQFGALKLCRTNDPWVAANPGAATEAPNPDCSAAAVLTRTLDGVWLGDAAELVPEGGEVSLMVLPTYSPPAAVGPPMSVAISGGAFTATSLGAPTTTVGGTGTPSGEADPTDLFGPSAGGSFGIGGFDAEPPDFGIVTPEPPPATTGVVAPSDNGDDEAFALPPLEDDGPGAPWIRLVALVPLSAGLGVGAARLRRAVSDGMFGVR
ncbi:MAG: hypothetical protein WD691_07585 [Acidimicrobiales bacterium]